MSRPAQIRDSIAPMQRRFVSTTLTDRGLGGENSAILRGLDDVETLKEQDRTDIVVTGSVYLVHSPITAGPGRIDA